MSIATKVLEFFGYEQGGVPGFTDNHDRRVNLFVERGHYIVEEAPDGEFWESEIPNEIARQRMQQLDTDRAICAAVSLACHHEFGVVVYPEGDYHGFLTRVYYHVADGVTRPLDPMPIEEMQDTEAAVERVMAWLFSLPEHRNTLDWPREWYAAIDG